MTVVEWVSIAKDFTISIAAAVTAFVALRGLRTWNRELRGKASFETARSLAKATYALRNAIHICRSPIIWSGEYPSEPLEPIAALRETRADKLTYVYSNRWKPVSAALQVFDAQMLEAEALWGSPVASAAIPLRQCLSDLNAAIYAVVDNARDGNEDFKADKVFGKQMRSTVHGQAADDTNEFSRQLASAVASLEVELRKHLADGSDLK